MVGIIAMAGTVEEYDQPCKKQRKDAEDSSTNTITSYFSPVSKSVDTAFPSPKSNILDYFKKTPSGRNVASNTSSDCEVRNSAVTSVDHGKESMVVSEGKHQTPKGKRLRRRVNLSRRLNECHEVVEISDTSTDSNIADVCGVRSGVGVLGSDTAALIAQLCAGSKELFEENEKDVYVDSNIARRRTTVGNRKKRCKEPVNHLSKNVSKKAQKRKFGGNYEDSPGQSDVELAAKNDFCEKRDDWVEAKGYMPVVIEGEKKCLSETSLDATADEICQMNDSTVTVSFEDFMKNQETEESSAEKAAWDKSEIVEESNKPLNLMEDESAAAVQPISPKTVTVHVQIHSSPISTSPQNSKTKQKKIASIFLRKKVDSESEAAEIQPASPNSAESTDPAPARRSNVVIAEEELELLVLDVTEKRPVKAKCSRVEREQFMNAFRRPPSSEPAKNGLKKATRKLKASKQGLVPGEAAEEADDEPDQENEKEESVQAANWETSSQGSKDFRVGKRDSGGATVKKNKKLKGRKGSHKIGKAECKNLDDCETGEEIDPNVITCDENTKGSRRPKHMDPAATRSSETCRITRRSLRQQRDALGYCLTPNKTIGVDCLDAPAHMSTPKLSHWSSEGNSIYKAEMIPATSNKSPIRMKFTRLSRSKIAREMDENNEFTPRSNQMCRSKNVAKAKRLVEKAKAQSKCRNPVESITPLRRSTRQQARSDGKPHRTEDLAIKLNSRTESDSVCILQHEKKPKKLRNLSDMLGKNPGSTSATKSSAADLKVASIFSGKKAVKAVPSGPITILDESSFNGSENSQDNEQFRAKRQFLMSGLPDTLKKHIAKTAAAMEVYSAACSSFQTVIHVQQKGQVSLLWNLAWPSCAILNQLREVSGGIEGILKLSLSLGDFSEVKCTTTTIASWTGLSNWRTEFSRDIQKCLLEEIRSSNPEFPVRRIFKPLLQKRNEHLAETLKAGSSNKLDSSVIELDTEPRQVLTLCSSPQRSLSKTKRKKERQELKQKQKRRKALDGEQDLVIIIDGEECTRELSSESEEPTERKGRGVEKQNRVAPTKNRRHRSVKKKQQELECKTRAAEMQNATAPSRLSELTDQPKREEAAAFDDPVKEDLLWTEKYQPQHSNELVGNLSAVKKLHSWLMEWKRRADQEEKKKQKEKNIEKDKKLDAWDNSDFDMESSEDEDFLCNTVLITGPPGVGKTAAVYACAQELGFKVFEVNASSQRSGRQILSQLKEATQSHQVDKQGASMLKPAFFNSYSSNRLLSAQTAKSPRKGNSPQKVASSPRKSPLPPRGRGLKRNLTPMSLANFFKAPSKSNKSEETEILEDKPWKNCKPQKSSPQVAEVTKIPFASESKDTGSEESSRKSATSLILFEEVDVIFDEDAGFLNAIKTFMATAKRPVILTTTDPNFSLMFESCFEEICFKVPSSANIASYLQLLCLAENLRTDTRDLTALLALNKCDIRQSILHLQFWVRSGGGYQVDKLLPTDGLSLVLSPAEEESVSGAVAAEGTLEDSSQGGSIVKMQDVPKCNTGCTENLLGFENVYGPSNDLFSMFKQEVVALEQWRSQVQILLEFQRRRLDFIFRNLEFLLPLPVRVVPDPKGPERVLAKETAPRACNPLRRAGRKLQHGDKSADSSPVKISAQMKRRRKVALFDDSDLFDSELNESDTFVTLPNEIPTSSSVADKAAGSQASTVSGESPSDSRTDSSRVTERQPRTLAEQKCCELVSLCLGSLAEFTDSVSFLDCCLHRGAVESEGLCGQSGYHWAAAEIKNGMLDERRIEQGDWWSSHSFGETRATMEALSWKKCRSQIERAVESSVAKYGEPGKDPMEELTLHIPHHQNSSAVFTQLPHYYASTASKRIEVLKTVFSSKAFVSLGNKRASAVEYLPALRTICRIEKLKEQGKLKRRFLHYLDGAHLELPKSTLEALAASFP